MYELRVGDILVTDDGNRFLVISKTKTIHLYNNNNSSRDTHQYSWPIEVYYGIGWWSGSIVEVIRSIKEPKYVN